MLMDARNSDKYYTKNFLLSVGLNIHFTLTLHRAYATKVKKMFLKPVVC